MCGVCAEKVRIAMRDYPAFEAIVTAAESLGLPLAFARDLYLHDRDAIARPDAPERFMWCVGSTGTTIAWSTLGKNYTDADAKAWARTLSEERPHAFEWNGRTLRKVPTSRVIGLARSCALS